jgi:hypothetical protein
MPSRTITAAGRSWRVLPSGRVTQNERDEFALLFVAGDGPDRITRVSRYSPMGARAREASFAELTEADLQRLFDQSQPSDTSPEADYAE